MMEKKHKYKEKLDEVRKDLFSPRLLLFQNGIQSRKNTNPVPSLLFVIQTLGISCFVPSGVVLVSSIFSDGIRHQFNENI